MGIKLSSLPPHIRKQVEAQLSREISVSQKASSPATLGRIAKNGFTLGSPAATPRSKCEVKRAGRAPRKRVPNGNESAFTEWAQRADCSLAEDWIFEPCTFHTPVGRYTPDWCVTSCKGDLNERAVFFEVKGAKRLRSEEGARKAFLATRARFPMFRFRWFRNDGNGGYFEEYAE